MEHETQTEKSNTIGRLTNILRHGRQSNWFLSASAALLLFVLCKFFLFDIVRVNNHDMRATFAYGDAVLIRRAFNTYCTNDFVYFIYPGPDSAARGTRLLQRIVGLPGDTIELVDKTLFINGMQILDTSSLRFNCFITLKNKVADSLFRTRYAFDEGGKVSNGFDYSYSLTQHEFLLLQKDTLVQKAELKREKPDNFDETCFPGYPQYSWNMDFYGPIRVPRRNDTLQLDTLNMRLYTALIRDHEHNALERRHDSIFINGVLASWYVPRQDYYFVLGDNRDNAVDSRVWGFLPRTFIRGKVISKLRSVQ